MEIRPPSSRLARLRARFLGVACLFAGIPLLTGAHQVSSVSLIAFFDTAEGSYVLDAAMEVVPSEDQAVNDQITPEQAAREFAEEYLTVFFDETEVAPELSLSVTSASDEETPPELRREQLLVKLAGDVPEGAEEFLLYLDPSCPMAVVMVVVKDDRPSRRMQVVLAGEYSRPVNVLPVVEGDPFVEGGDEKPAAEAEQGADSTDATRSGGGGGTESGKADEDEAGPETTSPFGAGFRSFFDRSLVPALFVGCLFLMRPGRKALFLATAALLVGLSLVVSLRAWDLAPSVGWAEGAAGLLLGVLGIEALLHGRFRWWRVALFGIAGLAAGACIADATGFREVFVMSKEAATLTDRILFVLGAEIAAVLFGLAVGAVLVLLSRFDWYRNSVHHPLAILVAGYGIYLAISSFG